MPGHPGVGVSVLDPRGFCDILPVVCATAAKFNVGHLPWQGFDGSFGAKREREREGWGKDGGGAKERLPRLTRGTRTLLRDS